MLKTVIGALLGAATMVVAASAGATTLLVDYSDTAGNSGSWEQASNPVPLSVDAPYTTTVSIWAYADSVPGVFCCNVKYVSAVYGGGVALIAGQPAIGNSPQLYSGSLSAPVFAPGTFSVLYNSYNGANATLTYSAVVPGPPTWSLMLVGFGGFGALYGLRRRAPARVLCNLQHDVQTSCRPPPGSPCRLGVP